jgi:hypothetical protein
VIVQSVRVSLSDNVDAAGARTPVLDLLGSGQVRMLRGGQAFDGSWSRPAASAPTTLRGPAGELTVAAGPVWVVLVAVGQPVRVSA